MPETGCRCVMDSSFFVVCRCNSVLCALPLDSVIETLRPLACRALAGMPPFILGLSVIRGEAIPIIDGAKLLGAVASIPLQRWVVLRAGVRRIGLAVEHVVGVREIPLTSLQNVPPLTHEVNDETLHAISVVDADVLLVIQSARLVPPSVWQAIEQEAA